jgi:hypothetical protein
MSFRAYSIEIVLTATATTQLTLSGLGANEALAVESATVVNSDASTRLLTMYLASGGAAASAANLIEYQKTCPIKTATNTSLSGKKVMPGAKLYAGVDSGTACTLQISGTIIPQAA